MAFSFDSTSTDYLQSSSVVMTTEPFSFFCRALGSGLTDSYMLYSEIDVSEADVMIVARLLASGAFEVVSRNIDWDAATTTNTITADGLWHSCIGVWTSTTLRESWLDNDDGNKGSNTELATIGAGTDTANVGYLPDPSPTDGDVAGIAELCIWDNYALTAGDRAALHAGLSPILIAPNKIVRYCPFIDNTDIVIGTGTWNSVNSYESRLPHPTVIYPKSGLYANDPSIIAARIENGQDGPGHSITELKHDALYGSF